ncbi:phosphodiester glycosidase family protein [Paenibacillus ginsengihumi]|uniref:phosphodiester glycosidase family protein n=1 Tax=Paenibacillus ginsengihumi TaxID=431596 RepID=UPI00035F134B|nr:phosphodiester glycosidase family protein [Paenibacillus ginsengihumi]
MNIAFRPQRRRSRIKRTLLLIVIILFVTSGFLYLTGPGTDIRVFLAQTVISTQHRSWAWILVGAERRDRMVEELQQATERAAAEKQDLRLVQVKRRSIDELIKVEDIQGDYWVGKKMYVYDPTTIRVMTPAHAGEGERITSMVKRTGAIAGVNGGGFTDPEGLGNGFAAIGAILSGGDIVFTDQDGSVKQHIVGFTKEGQLVIGKYDMFELREMGVTEAVSFYPRTIANGKPLITSGDGGWGRAPRTAVGQRADGTVIFVVIDGRQPHSIGATLREVQDLLLAEGAVNAGFLDGGASSEMVVGGELVTKPSSRYGERRLPSAFLVYDNPDKVKAHRPWDGVDEIDPGGSYDHPEFLREQAEKRVRRSSNASY